MRRRLALVLVAIPVMAYLAELGFHHLATYYLSHKMYERYP